MSLGSRSICISVTLGAFRVSKCALGQSESEPAYAEHHTRRRCQPNLLIVLHSGLCHELHGTPTLLNFFSASLDTNFAFTTTGCSGSSPLPRTLKIPNLVTSITAACFLSFAADNRACEQNVTNQCPTSSPTGFNNNLLPLVCVSPLRQGVTRACRC